MRPKLKWVIGIGIIILSFFLAAIYQLCIPISPGSSQEKVVDITKGMDAAQIAGLLKESGIIRGKWGFRVLAKLKRAENRLKAGEYNLSPSMNLIRVLGILEQGRVLERSFTIPEGYTTSQIARVLAELGLVDEERFLKLTYDQKFISELRIRATSLEGYLFNGTYCISKGSKEEEIIELMVGQFNKTITQNYRKRAAELGFTIHKIVTLASIIEKETSAPAERSLVSAVFHNRLKRGIPLQSDPTVIYALGKDFDGNLSKKDLMTESPYNTYLYPGLPPGPIANPGRAAIHAALYPAEVDYLYFVSKNDGTHKFSTTHQEHIRAVRKYQKRR
jgi:UPF0755 protein